MAVKLPLPAVCEIEPRMSPYSPMSPEAHGSDFTSASLDDDGIAGIIIIFILFIYTYTVCI